MTVQIARDHAAQQFGDTLEKMLRGSRRYQRGVREIDSIERQQVAPPPSVP